MGLIRTISFNSLWSTLGKTLADKVDTKAKVNGKQTNSQPKQVIEYDDRYEVSVSLGPSGPEKPSVVLKTDVL